MTARNKYNGRTIRNDDGRTGLVIGLRTNREKGGEVLPRAQGRIQ